MSHRRGFSCSVYKICHCDSYSIKRHDERRHEGETDTVPFYTVGMEIARENIIKHEAQKFEKVANVNTSLKEGNSTNSNSSDTAMIHKTTIVDTIAEGEAESENTKSKDPCDVPDAENSHTSAYELLTAKSKQSTLKITAKTNKPQVPSSDLSLE